MDTEAFIENLLKGNTDVPEEVFARRDYLHNLLDKLQGGYTPLRHSAIAPDLPAGSGPQLDPSTVVTAPAVPIRPSASDQDSSGPVGVRVEARVTPVPPKPPSPPVKTQGSAPNRSRSPACEA